jgi:hypothetical protein
MTGIIFGILGRRPFYVLHVVLLAGTRHPTVLQWRHSDSRHFRIAAPRTAILAYITVGRFIFW